LLLADAARVKEVTQWTLGNLLASWIVGANIML